MRPQTGEEDTILELAPKMTLRCVVIIAFVVLMGQSCFAEKRYIRTIPYSEFEQILNEGNAVVCCSARREKYQVFR